MLLSASRAKYLHMESSICSCGNHIKDCRVWGEVLKNIEACDKGVVGNYDTLIGTVHMKYSDDVVISDSSKYSWALQHLIGFLSKSKNAEHGMRLEDLLVIHLVRDVRGFVTSVKRAEQIARWNFPKLIKWFKFWYKSNRDMDYLLDKYDIDRVPMSYDALCLDQKGSIETISSAIGLQLDVNRMGDGVSHIGVGNHSRLDPVKTQAIMYDWRWFEEFFIQMIYFFFPRIRNYNKQKIYRNKKI